MQEPLPYVTIRRNRNGNERYYWQRKGHKLIRLPEDRARRYALVLKLNERADLNLKTSDNLSGSLGWVIQKYKESDIFVNLAPGSKRYYEQCLREILSFGKDFPFASFDRSTVVNFIETCPLKSRRRKLAAVLRNLFNTANYHDIAPANHARDLRLEGQKRRLQIWTAGQCTAWLAAAPQHPKGAAMAVAFNLLAHTIQRPGDVLKLVKTQYSGLTIRMRQQKTGKQLEIPCTEILKTVLDESIRTNPGNMMLVAHNGRPLHYIRFHEAFNEIKALAGLPEELQPRDLRRTAMVNLAMNGATSIEISAMSGHTIEQTEQILETYIPRNLAMAQNAIARLERKKV